MGDDQARRADQVSRSELGVDRYRASATIVTAVQ
jgi:hypothetical protein